MTVRSVKRLWLLSTLQCRRVPYQPYCYFSSGTDSSGTDSTYVVDIRSDTVTKPSVKMREAMSNALVGDDVFGEDPTVNELQDKMSDMFGKEAALFVPTGTMGNLISIMSHCQARGLEVLLGNKSHIFMFEQGGIAQVAGVQPRTLNTFDDGTFSVDELESSIRPKQDLHQPWTKMVCVENTQNLCGGKVVPLEFLEKVGMMCRKHDLLLHMDGARLFNAASATDVSTKEILKHCDSVSICFSKGLGAPVGSLVAGSKSFIENAVRVRKVLGGGMRQAGILAAAALYALEHHAPKLKHDHVNVRSIAESIMSEGGKIATIDIDGLHSNIGLVDFPTQVDAPKFCHRLLKVTEEESRYLGDSIVVKMLPFGNERTARYVTHIDLTLEDIQKVQKKVKYVLREFAAGV